MNLQRIQWKIFFAQGSPATPEDFFRVLNTWIGDGPEIFVDVANYAHVHDGPLTVLIGHEGDYVLDVSGRELGFVYSRKLSLAGDNATKIKQTLNSLIHACQRLEGDTTFAGKLKFATGRLVLTINDRALAPNTSQTYDVIRPILAGVFKGLVGSGDFKLTHLNDPKQRFAVRVDFSSPLPLRDFDARLRQ